MRNKMMKRRRVLRGMLQGSAVAVGLPLLDLFLNDSGTALANDEPLPVCFGTWHWGLGLCHGQWVPEQTGRAYQLRPHLETLSSIKDKINIYSGMQVMTDNKGTECHFSGQQCIMTGGITDSKKGFGRSIDDVVATQFGTRTRFASLTVSCDGDPAESFSSRGGHNMNPAEISPVGLYQRIFGNEFRDPNTADFEPDPAVMLRKSTLSAVSEERQALMKAAGTRDRARLDEFFTSLRSLERKLTLELERPAPLASCRIPRAPEEAPRNREVEVALRTHAQFSELLSYALACGQTRVFNMSMSYRLVQAGDATSFHQHTHEDPVDPLLGYQPNALRYALRYMEALQNVVSTLDKIKEGDGTLLDRVLLLAYTDHGDARIHSYKELPFFTAGRAGGRLKTGLHVSAPNEPCSRLSLTCLQALGLPMQSWGEGSNDTSQVLSEVLA